MTDLIDMLTATPEEYARLVRLVALLAAEDAEYKRPERPGKDLARRFCSDWRKGHERHLRLVYTGARWHAETRDT